MGIDDADEASGIHQLFPPTPELSQGPLRAAELTRWLYQLTPERLAFREQIKELLARDEFAPREELGLEQRAEGSYARFKLLREALDLRIRDVIERPARLAAALELVGVIDATLFTVMNIHYCLCGGSLLRQGSGAPELEAILQELDALETIGTFLVTELGYGNNAVSLQTRVDYDPERGDLVLSTPCAEARKFMPNTALSGVPKLGVVMARLFVRGEDHGVFPVVVRLRTSQGPCAGVSITPLGSKPVYSLDNAITSFHGVRVPKHFLLLGEHSRLDADGTFASRMPSKRARFLWAIDQVQLGRLCLSGVGATALGASAFVAIKYAEQRRTFAPRHADVSVLEYRNHQRDVFSALAHAYASRIMLNFAMDRYTGCDPSEQDYLFRISAASKAHVCYATERLVRLCRERCGAAGMFEENRLSGYAAQAQGLVTAEGDNHILLIKIARLMLLRKAYVRLHEPRQRPAGGLTHPQRLLWLVRERERRLLDQLRLAMARAQLPGHDFFNVWNDNINLALETAMAHASRLTTERFCAQTAELPMTHPVIDLLRVFVLQELAPHLGFYLAEDLVSREEVRQHGATLDRLCQALRPHALELAAGCDVLNELLRAPLASDDYVACYDARARQDDPEPEAPGGASQEDGNVERDGARLRERAAGVTRPQRSVSGSRPSSTQHAR